MLQGPDEGFYFKNMNDSTPSPTLRDDMLPACMAHPFAWNLFEARGPSDQLSRRATQGKVTTKCYTFSVIGPTI